MNMANSRVLVLNRSWTPVDILGAFDAIGKVFKGRAKFLDVETCAQFDFYDWIENWEDAIQTAKVASERVVHSSRFSFLIPEVIVCTEYKGFGYRVSYRRPKFSRGNIYRRDRSICQYCGKKFPTEKLSIDHIIPKSKGGLMTWDNVVLACISCNGKKDNRTPDEAGLRLIKKPHRPTAEDLTRNPIDRILHKVGYKVPKTWVQFLGKSNVVDEVVSTLYWNTELKE